MTPVLLAVAGVGGVAAVGLRITLWRSHPSSRPLTAALALLMIAAVLSQPAIISNEWVDHATPQSVRLANVSNLIGDLAIVAAACGLALTVGKAWGQRNPVRRAALLFGSITVLLLVLYAVSEAHVTPTMYIGGFGGWAKVYIYVVAISTLAANLAVLISVAYAYPVSPRTTRIALCPMAIGAGIGAALMALLLVDSVWPNAFDRWYADATWPCAAAMVLAYAISGILGYRELRARPVEVPATG